MKKILLIFLVGMLFACSTEEDPEPPEPENKVEYYIYLKEDCTMGVEGASHFQVTEDVFHSVVDNSGLLDCNYFSIPDTEGNIYEGYHVGHGAKRP